jgi:hypothetical protein
MSITTMLLNAKRHIQLIQRRYIKRQNNLDAQIKEYPVHNAKLEVIFHSFWILEATAAAPISLAVVNWICALVGVAMTTEAAGSWNST